MLEIKDLLKTYGEKVAVNHLSIQIEPGQLYGFIGHNGAGKTTTLKSVVGILPVEHGEILLDGVSIQENPMEFKRQIAYIPDNPEVYGFLTGIEYLNLIGDIYGVSSEIRTQRIQHYASIFSLTEELSQEVSSYSHGMKQKLLIISALIHQPKLIILDEPFVGLDPAAAFELKKIMREFCDEGGAIFFSTHVLEVAEKLCDHIAIIKQGQLIVSGETKSILQNESLEQVFLELEGYHAVETD